MGSLQFQSASDIQEPISSEGRVFGAKAEEDLGRYTGNIGTLK